MNETLERQIIQLIAADRVDIPVSSMSGKLKRQKPKLAAEIQLPDGSYEGDRVYARVQLEEGKKARGMSEAIKVFSEQYPRHGEILQGLIAEQRVFREPHLYFGVNPGSRLTSEDYMQVMTGLGFSEIGSRALYPELMRVSRNLSRQKRRAEEERSILIG